MEDKTQQLLDLIVIRLQQHIEAADRAIEKNPDDKSRLNMLRQGFVDSLEIVKSTKII